MYVSYTLNVFVHFSLFRSFVMATTEMESGSLESRSEQGTVDSDSKYPLKVLYCGGTVYDLLISLASLPDLRVAPLQNVAV